MANELVTVELLGNGGDIIEVTCLDNTQIPKGTVIELEDLRTGKKVSAANKPLIGYTAAEKVANDGATTVGVITNSIAKAVCGASGATVGLDQVAEDGSNTLTDYDTLDNEKGYVLGQALETATSGETYLVRVKK